MSTPLARWRVLWAVSALALLLAGCPQTDDSANNGAADGGSTNGATANTAPVADAGADQSAAAGDLVVLDGTGSSDADGDRLVFIWQQIGGEPQVDLDDAISSRPRFYAPQDLSETVVLTFRLFVVDGLTADYDDVAVTVEPAASD